MIFKFVKDSRSLWDIIGLEIYNSETMMNLSKY